MLRIAVTGVLALGLMGSLSPAYAWHHYRHYYHRTPAICSQFNFDVRATRSLQPVALPPLGRCEARISHGYPIPDPMCTPGAVNPTVTIDVLRNPVFRTKCVRNQATSEHEKFVTYHWYRIRHPYDNRGESQVCELDHLVPLELGGADTLDNIWPECGPAGATLRRRYFKQKDKVENYLAKMVRDGRMGLGEAQKGIADDWTQYLPAAEREHSFSN